MGPHQAAAVRVFLVDDHEVLRRGLREVLEHDEGMTVVGETGLAAEALSRVLTTRPHVVVLDVRLPDGSGIDVCRALSERLPTLPVLVLSSYADDETVYQAIMAGASGYLMKDAGAREVAGAVRQLAAGKSLLDPSITREVLERLRHGSPVDPVLARLTGTERRVLDLLAEGLTNRQIAVRTRLSEKTVKNYVSEILGKLGLHSRTQAAVLAVQRREGGDTAGTPPAARAAVLSTDSGLDRDRPGE